MLLKAVARYTCWYNLIHKIITLFLIKFKMCKYACIKLFIGVTSGLILALGLVVTGFTMFMVLTTTWTTKDTKSISP